VSSYVGRVCPALVVAWWCFAPASADAQGNRAVEGVWSTTLTASDSPVWTVADLLCDICTLAAYHSFESLVADPANRDRSLEELRDQARRAGLQDMQQLYTDAGRARLASYKPPPDPSVRCDPPLSPLLLATGPLPMSIEIDGDRAILRFQDWNTRREIAITRGPATAGGSGLSTSAHFDGEALVVESLNVPALASMGTTDRARIIERYSPDGNGARLEVQLTIDDPETFREPLVFQRAHVRTPDVKLFDYDPCGDLSRGPGERVP
jgi:hypothetical protein